MWIRIQLFILMQMRIRIQLIALKRIRILPFNLMRIHADPDYTCKEHLPSAPVFLTWRRAEETTQQEHLKTGIKITIS
jgi:hypothetical protein